MWADNMFACHWNHMLLLMSMIKPLRDVAVVSCRWWCHRVILVMALLKRRWLWCVVAAESCWRWHYRVLLVMVLPRQCWSCHDVAIEASWPWRNVAAKSCWWRCYQGDLAVAWCCCRVMLVTALQLKVVLPVVRLCSPQAQSIEVLSQHEEVRLACQSSLIFVSVYSRVITGKIS
jgi:hypothetical protein